MTLKLMGSIAGLGLVVVGLSACTKYDYDPNQPRNWEKFYVIPGAQSVTKIDTLSIKGIEEGVQFDQGSSSIVRTIALNCATGGYTITKEVTLDNKGGVAEYKDNPQIRTITKSIAEPYSQVCKQVGEEPAFLSFLDQLDP